MNQLEVQIMGQSYLLACPEEGASRLQQAVAKVDAAMCAIRDAGKVKARDRIAVLAALNLAFDQPERAATETAPATADEAAGSDEHLASLLARLDEALGDDGRLI
ncbi:cell division protein ZapA [Variovorax sp. HJSM1_2]|uniref:cell division protein ZapA n=1 Tax=Variovorax sp. HJSM1_2 TaxID=3366263 RepID=UPI003BBBD793